MIRHKIQFTALIKKQWDSVAVGFLVGLFCLYFIFFTFNRYTVGYTNRLDLGHMDQTVWNTLHGQPFTLTDINTDTQISRFAIHADVMLALLAPFYLVWSDPRMLLLLQTLALGSGAIPIFLVAKKMGLHRIIALSLAISYLLYPPMQRAMIFDFHAVTLATPLILWAFYFLKSSKAWLFTLFCVLALLTKEQVALSVFGLGIYAYLQSKFKRMAAAVMLISLIWFYLMIWKVMPYFREGAQHFALGYYSDYGDSPGSIIKNVFLNPTKVVITFFTEGKWYYLFQLAAPVGFLLLLSPAILMLIPELGIDLTSTNHQMWTIFFQYTAVLTPLIFISSILGTANIVKLANHSKLKAPYITVAVSSYILITTIGFAWYWGPLPGARLQDIKPITEPRLRFDQMQQAQKLVPTDKVVSAVDDMAPFFSQRHIIYSFPHGAEKADIVILSDEYLSYETNREGLAKVLDNPAFKLIYHENKLLIYENTQVKR
jgi:uncharacterized membrane protein